MEASNSHSYLTDKKIQAKKSTHDEHKQGQSQFRAVENNPGSVVMNSCATLPAPQPPSNTVTTQSCPSMFSQVTQLQYLQLKAPCPQQ